MPETKSPRDSLDESLDVASVTNALRDELRGSWQRYIDLLDPLRPGLHAYCRRLTRDVWDAEDLVQDTLLRAFGTLGSLHQDVGNPRAYLMRTATHAWIDTLRRRDAEAAALAKEEVPVAERNSPGGTLRDAGQTLMQRLAPRERAAVVLKDVFDMSLEETATVLATSVGAVKAALHRGRNRLAEPEESAPERALPSRALIDRFVDLFNAEDKAGLISLFQETASTENVGCGIQYGPDALNTENSWFAGALGGHLDWPEEWRYQGQRAAASVFDGEPVILVFRTRRDQEKLEIVVRIEEENERVARMRSYGFCPETMREVAAALELPVLTGPYRFPTPAPGESYEF